MRRVSRKRWKPRNLRPTCSVSTAPAAGGPKLVRGTLPGVGGQGGGSHAGPPAGHAVGSRPPMQPRRTPLAGSVCHAHGKGAAHLEPPPSPTSRLLPILRTKDAFQHKGFLKNTSLMQSLREGPCLESPMCSTAVPVLKPCGGRFHPEKCLPSLLHQRLLRKWTWRDHACPPLLCGLQPGVWIGPGSFSGSENLSCVRGVTLTAHHPRRQRPPVASVEPADHLPLAPTQRS